MANAGDIDTLVPAVALAEHDIEHIVLAVNVKGAVVEFLSHNRLCRSSVHAWPAVANCASVVPSVNIDTAPVVGRDSRVFDVNSGSVGYKSVENILALHDVAHASINKYTSSEHGIVGER